MSTFKDIMNYQPQQQKRSAEESATTVPSVTVTEPQDTVLSEEDVERSRAERLAGGASSDNTSSGGVEHQDDTKDEKPAGDKADTTTSKSSGGSPLTYDDMIGRVKSEYDKKREDMEKKRKRDAIFAAIGDGFNAFHKAYAHARGIKPMESKSATKEVVDRYDKLFNDLNLEERAYLSNKMNAKQADQRQKNYEQEQAFKREQAAQAAEERRLVREQTQSNRDAELGLKGIETSSRVAVNNSTIASNNAKAEYYRKGGSRSRIGVGVGKGKGTGYGKGAGYGK